MAKKKKNLVKGKIRVHPRGFGFVTPEEGSEDIFIPKRMTKSAVDGDEVMVELRLPFSEKGPEGRVHKIVKRSRSLVAGIVVIEEGKKEPYAYVPLLGQQQMMRLALPFTGTHGDRVMIEVIHWGSARKEPQGKVVEKVGHILDPKCDVKAAIAEYEIVHVFPEEAIAEAKHFGKQVQEKDLAGRKDFRNLEIFTIDPETAKDFDDALSLSQDQKGYHLGVHIADVSYYVRPGSALDASALSRCNSVYFPGDVVPMLPHELSSHLCSLMPHVDRLCLSVCMDFDFEGNLLEYEIVRSVIHSQKRFTYEEAKKVLDGHLESPHKAKLELMRELCGLLKKKRAERGSIEFALPDISLRLNKEGIPEDIIIVEYDITHQLVEEFMLKANEMVATFLSEQEKPLAYRIHEEPSLENMREFSTLCHALGFSLSVDPTAEELQKLFDEARSTAFGKVLATSFIRSMKLASYSTQNIGHYGLGLDYYTHFTSPIRRYIDLMVHRAALDEMQDAAKLEEIALLCSEKERLSAKAENAVTLLKKLRYLYQVAAKKTEKSFLAAVTKVGAAGLSFELEEFFLEGFIPSFHLPRKPKYVGDKIKVFLEDIDLITLETKWKLGKL